MQAATTSLHPPPPHLAYQNVYHTPPGPQDHDLKRQYLQLLPPQQIIEICLAFEIHAPHFVKGSIWPPNINAAIEGLRKPPATNDTQNGAAQEPAVMDSLAETAQTSTPSQTPTEPRPPDKKGDVPRVSEEPNGSSAPTSATASTSTHPSFPPHAFSYPYFPSAYPHTPYYPPPPGYPPYPHSPYPHYPPPSNGYHPTTPSHPPAQSSPVLNQANHNHPIQEAMSSLGDDLPSYEEMIVEALTDCADPDGCAPKDLFAWMASRYPLQSNFRPSASQALQKAFKRGRFEKSNGGKYRLSATWEGGNTSRRTTRRPQTQSQNSAASQTPSNPFTHAPLVHHQHQHPHPPHPFQPPGYGYPYPTPPGFPPFPAQNQNFAMSTTSNEKTLSPSEKEAADAYEAAKTILTAINFSNLLPLSVADDTSRRSNTAEASDSQHTQTTSPTGIEQPVLPFVNIPHSDGEGIGSSQGLSNARAELQAHLALLAAQLAELAHEDEPPSVQTVTAPATNNQTPTATVQEGGENSEEDDMEEVI